MDRDKTVDLVIVGDPEKEVRRCLVTWISSHRACQLAAERGVELLITHEPTFWDHWDDKPEKNPNSSAKLKLIQDAGLVILRNHDTWDRFPEVGIPWAWARHLGLDGPPAAIGADGYQHRYDIAPVALDVFAKRVARRTALLGEPHVQVTGDPRQKVKRIGVGTGCGCDLATFRGMGCDCSIVCDDGSCYWAGIQLAEDLGHPVIRVNHGTSEEPGMVTLTAYLNEHLPGVSAEHIPHGATFHLVGDPKAPRPSGRR